MRWAARRDCGPVRPPATVALAGRPEGYAPPSGSLCPDAPDVGNELVYLAAELLVFLQLHFDLLAGVHDGTMIFVPEEGADLREGMTGELPGEVHRDPAGQGKGPGAVLAQEVRHLDAEVLADFLLDPLDGDVPVVLHEEVPQHLAGHVLRDGLIAVHGLRGHADQRAFQLPDAVADSVGDEQRHLIRQVDVVHLRLPPEDGDPRLQIGQLNVGDEPPLEPRAQPLFQRGDILGRAVTGEHNLLAEIVQMVEGVEELLLRGLLAGEEVDIVNQEHVHRPELLLEQLPLVALDGQVDELVHELFRGGVHHPESGILLPDGVADGLHEVGFAQPGAAIN